ncbi:hypothetical protein B0J11DRAFT_480593 [Dendryphion nanum]|uniref:Uncharacterized protein n=1 Tax=Dendryphion nanum TaxID=256645 RepID=A0A9P9E3R5_9PLEO|nr:hypothetical protein B0J11DRAFT_480593 [Dendryphion nanum]
MFYETGEEIWCTIDLTTDTYKALSSALGHYLLYKELDGTITDGGFLKQSHVSTVALLIGASFKASQTASVGLSFAQHLWYILRIRAVAVQTIERLFVLRSNIFELVRFSNMRSASILCLMGAYIWCLGLAIVYPPSSLTVAIGTFPTEAYHKLAVMMPPVPEESSGVLTNIGPSWLLNNLVIKIIKTGQVNSIGDSPGENSTYSLAFMAPQFKCKSERHNLTVPITRDLNLEQKLQDYSGNNRIVLSVDRMFSSGMNQEGLFVIKKGYLATGDLSTPHRGSASTSTYHATINMHMFTCEPQLLEYKINISYPKSVQKVEYSTSAHRPFLPPYWEANLKYKWPKNHSDSMDWGNVSLSSYPEGLVDYVRSINDIIPVFSQRAILDAVTTNLAFNWTQSFTTYQRDCYEQTVSNKNMSCAWNLLEGSVLQDPSIVPIKNRNYSRSAIFDPRQLNFTQHLLNELLFNVTISALSLKTWQDRVLVRKDEYKNIYKFSHPQNLIIPYAVCMSLGIFFVAVGMFSMWKNRISTVDGGFLQIMLATRGNTEMERLALREGNSSPELISKEMKNLKLRYGELVIERGSNAPRRFGLGTEEETISLRKRRRSKRAKTREIVTAASD